MRDTLKGFRILPLPPHKPAYTQFKLIRGIYNICNNIATNIPQSQLSYMSCFLFVSSHYLFHSLLIFCASQVGYCFLTGSSECSSVHFISSLPFDQSFWTFFECWLMHHSLHTYDTSHCFSVGSVHQSFVMFGRRSPSLHYRTRYTCNVHSRTHSLSPFTLFSYYSPNSWFFSSRRCLWCIHPRLPIYSVVFSDFGLKRPRSGLLNMRCDEVSLGTRTANWIHRVPRRWRTRIS